MDDRRPLAAENNAQQHQCHHAQSHFAGLNSPIRDGHYYDPVHESRDWYQGISNSPGQTSHTSQTGPVPGIMPFIPFQNTSHNFYQEPLHSSPQSQDPNASRPNRMSFNLSGNDYQGSSATPITNQTNFNGITSASNHYPQYAGLAHSSPLGLDFVPSLYRFHIPRSSLSNTPNASGNITAVRPDLRITAFPQQERNTDLSSDTNTSSQLDYSQPRRRNIDLFNVFAENEENFFSNTIMALQEQSEDLFYAFPGRDEQTLAALRGVLTSGKRTLYKEAIDPLEPVTLEELTGSDRSCIICYNEFGIKNPEGVIEIPLRLPRCKHIFGDKCIKKWFEDSDSCPYCRDKPPSKFSLKKTSHFEATRATRERLYATGQRPRPESLAMRHLSVVELANTRPLNATEVIGQPISGGSESPVNRETPWASASAGRSTIDSPERRRQFRGRMGNFRSIYQMNRPTPVWSSRAVNSNPSLPGHARMGSQISDTLNSSMPEFVSRVSSYTGNSRATRAQTPQVNVPPNLAWQSSRSGESRSSSPEINPLSNAIGGGPSVSRLIQHESPNDLRIEMRRGAVDASNSFHHVFNNDSSSRTAQQDFGSRHQDHSSSQSATETFPALFTPRR